MKFKTIEERDLRSKEQLKFGYAKNAVLSDADHEKPLIAEAIKNGALVRLKASGTLVNGVEWVDIRVYFKVEQ